MKKNFSAFCLFFAFIFSAISEISFDNPQINESNKILFTVTHDLTGTHSYRTLFTVDAANNKKVDVLTCFPEKMELLSDGKMLQIRNRYGVARYSFVDSNLTWISRFSTFPSDAKCLEMQSVSSDGKWIVYLKKTGSVKSALVLKNAVTSEEKILDYNAEFSYESVPAKWAPDGKFLVYEKGGLIYFCEPNAVFKETEVSDEYRKIGNGTINSVAWANAKSIIYVSGGVIYKISTNELYTRGLYSSVVGTGAVLGRLPLGFDERKDRFWVNSDLTRIITIRADSIISSYRINGVMNSSAENLYSKPFSNEAGTSVDYNVFWTGGDSQILWVKLIGNSGEKRVGIFRLSDNLKLIKIVENPGEPDLSPDGKKIAFTSNGSLFVYDVDTWTECAELTGEKIVSHIWNGNNSIIAGGESFVRSISVLSGKKSLGSGKILFLSSVKSAYWVNGETVCALSSGKASSFYIYDQFKKSWRESAVGESEFSPSIQNADYRVFVGKTGNLHYENTLYVRSLRGSGFTKAVFEESARNDVPLKRVALVFDALDNAEGVSSVLSVLSDYGIKATFFLNGEFIRRYPKETNQIAKSAHDCASMYFAATDLTEKKFVYDEEFIRRGLARNEDEFFSVTGCELSPLWHAPYYKSNEKIRKAAEESGYRYIEAGRLALDTFTLEKAASGKQWYLNARDIVTVFAENVTDGMVIPVNLGISGGTRTDYLYEKLDLLIGSLLDEGCQFVLVQSLK